MAKTYRNLYPRIVSFESLYRAYKRACKGRRFDSSVLAFGCRLDEHIVQLQNELIWHTYRTGQYRSFVVREPKIRVVSALPFRDRVVQHALVAVLEPIWEPRYIFDSYACRSNKGTHAGADRAQEFLRDCKRENGTVYVLKGDIRHYFPSIDHETLKGLVRRRVACPDTLRLIDGIIDSSPTDRVDARGLPIGNLTSQLFANIYLNELDHFVKETLCERRYLRYMDDFVVVHHDKRRLHEVRNRIESYLWEHLSLETNAKTQVFPVHPLRGRSLDFLGYRIWPTHRKLRKNAVRRMKNGLRGLVKGYSCGFYSIEHVVSVVNSWLGHARHANAHTLTAKLLGEAIFLPPRHAETGIDTPWHD